MYKAIKAILLSTLLISGTAWGGWFLYNSWRQKQAEDPAYLLKALVVKSLTEEPVKPLLVAEWLDLSVDRPINLWKVSCSECERRLARELPVKRAKVSKVFPSTLKVELELRRPIALLSSESNIALDEEGKLFPLLPYYTPKNLPRVDLGSKENFRLAKELLAYLEKRQLNPVRVDLSKVLESSFGEREIVVKAGGAFLRLNPERWQEGIDNFCKIRHLDPFVADMRLNALALIRKKETSHE